jgi:hypothetical protein
MSATIKYELNNLEWQHFEVLALKCLQKDVSSSVQFIEGGNDKGRDAVYEGVTEFFTKDDQSKKYIFQAKHKTNLESHSSLASDLKKELEKVFITNKLQYDIYCLVTNLSFSGDQFDVINREFINFFKENPVEFEVNFQLYSYWQFDACIESNREILWRFPSIVRPADFRLIIEQVLDKNESSFTKAWYSIFEKGKDKFVYTNVYDIAIDKLYKNHILLLSGPPKSGKTFNAEMILLHKVGLEDFLPYKIDNVDEFEKYYDKDKKQIFLFDDVFGKHNIEKQKADSIDRKLELIFELIDLNHLFIFTSREYIFRAFKEYSEKDTGDFISRINVDVNDLSIIEKEIIFCRYYNLKFPGGTHLEYLNLKSVAEHVNFSPETVRAFFDNNEYFSTKDLFLHLDLPDKYLEKVFVNLKDEHKHVLLGTLFSLKEDEISISYSYQNVRIDLNSNFLINLKNELDNLDGSIIKKDQNRYYFYHPSMFDFFVKYLSSDVALYRKLLFKNLNLSLLSISKFKINKRLKNQIQLTDADLNYLITGFERIINCPTSASYEINTLFLWFDDNDTQLNFQIKQLSNYIQFRDSFYMFIRNMDLEKLSNDNIYDLSIFFNNVSSQIDRNLVGKSLVRKLVTTRKQESEFWMLFLSLTPFVTYDEMLTWVGKDWANDFYKGLKNEIDQLGGELFGNGYPEFKELKEHKRLVDAKDFTSANSIKFRSKMDYKQSTNEHWFPRYKICKAKMKALKVNLEFGPKIYNKLLENFEHFGPLIPNQHDRYLFNKRKKWWS